MKKGLITILLILSIQAVFAQPVVISVSDFLVESDNPAYKYLGKGLSRLVAGELRKSGKVKILEREQMTRLIQEQQFALSDLADSSKQVQIGMMLSANKIIFGEIIDIGEKLLISCRMADVETGEIVWQDDITESLKTYDYIGAYLAQSVLWALGLNVEAEITEKVVKKEEKDVQAIVELSEGIDSYDRGDTEAAKAKLEKAKEIDPGNEVVGYYLSKLVVNTSKFKAITDMYLPNQNPAYLGIIQFDKFSLTTGGTFSQLLWGDSHTDMVNYPDLQIGEIDARFNFSYQFPLGDNLGLGATAFLSQYQDDIYDPINHPTDSSSRLVSGLNLSFGWQPVSFLSAGITGAFYLQSRSGWVESIDNSGTDPYQDPLNFLPAVSGGLLLKNSASTVLFDILAGYSPEKTLYFNPATFPNRRDEAEERSVPFYLENTFTLGLNGKTTFLVVKQQNDLFLDTGHYYLRLLPAFEQWLNDAFSVRLGVEGSLVQLSERSWGLGAALGGTYRHNTWDYDLNLTYRKRPSRFVDGETLDELLLLFIVSKNDTLLKR